MKPSEVRILTRAQGGCGLILPPPPGSSAPQVCILPKHHDDGKHETTPHQVFPEGMTVAQVEEALAYARTQGATDFSPVMFEHTVYDEVLVEDAVSGPLSEVEELHEIDDGGLLQANITRVVAESRCEDGPPTVYVCVERLVIT